MLDKLASALDFQRQVLSLRAERQTVLANNIANADTPGYKARDFDFAQALAAASGRGGAAQPLALATTSPGHLQGQGGQAAPALLYRVPDQPSLDGNTVNMNVERVAFADNAVQYQVALSLASSRLQGLRAAMRPA